MGRKNKAAKKIESRLLMGVIVSNLLPIFKAHSNMEKLLGTG